MRQMTWVRIGLASVILAGGAMAGLAAGCGGDDTTGPGATPDSGHADVTQGDVNVPDSPAAETGPKTDAEAGPPPAPNGKVLIAHASPYLFNAEGGGIRFCFATAKGNNAPAVPPLVALPDDDSKLPAGQPFPGVFPGTGGALPDFGLDLSQYSITGYIISAAKLKALNEVKSNATEDFCDTLIGSDGKGKASNPNAKLTLGTDYFQVNTIPAGTVTKGTTTFVALTGCQSGATDQSTILKCGGAAYAGAANGNLAVQFVHLDRNATNGALGYQFANAAMPWDNVAASPLTGSAAYAGTVGLFLSMSADAGPDGSPALVPVTPPTPPQKEGQISDAGSKADLGKDPSNTYFGVLAIGADGGPVIPPGSQTPYQFALPLKVIQALTYGPASLADGGNEFANGSNYTFILLGDPDPNTQQLFIADDAGNRVPNPQYRGYGVHIIAFQNDPPLGP